MYALNSKTLNKNPQLSIIEIREGKKIPLSS